MFCRHGDRTPGANFFEPREELARKEVAVWLTELLTVADTRKLYAAFPIQVLRGQRRPRDEAMGVFGSLTHRGLRQMQALGDSLRLSYAKLLPRRSRDSSTNTSSDGGVDFSNVECTSSNYRRTMHSAQALLGGLLPQYDTLYEKLAADLAKTGASDVDGDGWISGEEFDAAAARDQESGALLNVQVKVSKVDREYINVYPLIPEIADLMRQLKKTMPHTQGKLKNALVGTKCVRASVCACVRARVGAFLTTTQFPHVPSVELVVIVTMGPKHVATYTCYSLAARSVTNTRTLTSRCMCVGTHPHTLACAHNHPPGELEEQRRIKEVLEDEVPAFGFKMLPFSWSQALDLLTSRISRLHRSTHRQGRRALISEDATIANLFRFTDRDGTGVITREEFHHACRQLFRDSLAQDDIDTCFDNVVDVHGAGDGAIEFPAWQQFFADLQGSYARTDSLNLRHLLADHVGVVERVVCRTFEHWCVRASHCCVGWVPE